MIDSIFSVLRKLVVSVIAVVFLFTITYIPVPHTTPVAEAQFAVTEVGPNLATNVITTTLTTSIELIGSVLDGIAWAVAKQMISMMLDSLVDWINSGFQGSPAFVQDIRRFLLEAADIAIGEYLYELGGPFSFVCSPFRLDVQLAVALEYDLSRTDDVPSCRVTTIINNFEQFVTGDFAQGGWEGWFNLVTRPSQTPYGQILTAKTQARARILNAEGESMSLLNFGDGFLSGKLCETYAGPNGPQEECFITKPGKVISEQLNKALGAGQDQLVAADEINEVISALVAQLANRAITGAAGLLGLSGSTGYTPYSRGSFAAEVQGGGATIVGGVNQAPNAGTVPVAPPLDSVSVPLTNRLSATLAAQQTFFNQIDGFTSSFRAIINNPGSNEFEVAQAQGALLEAESIRNQIAQGIGPATTMVNQYVALENEYATADASRQIAIRTEQSTIIQNFTALGLPGDSYINSMLARWNAIITVSTPNPLTEFCDINAFTELCEQNGAVRF